MCSLGSGPLADFQRSAFVESIFDDAAARCPLAAPHGVPARDAQRVVPVLFPGFAALRDRDQRRWSSSDGAFVARVGCSKWSVAGSGSESLIHFWDSSRLDLSITETVDPERHTVATKD